ncbi:tetratricopeptide repeat protein [Cohnella sp. WQ 127256]|uniref:tetratricopeptide repeat protein n=1 Tax=Cohnella sp. WQ 127256 TaxID=2938790 RepID=UPI0021188AAF|nr:tetratricopeptide repeat protein [Cohnella sp. WQ 127256]
MIREWFATMNDVLDDLILRYPQASGEEKNALQQQWDMLKSLSDDIIESWLQLEDKMGMVRDIQQQPIQVSESQKLLDSFVKGQGYFKLHMFKHASDQLKEAVTLYPDFVGARILLAMSCMHMKQWGDAQRHFQLIEAITEESKLQAIAYNALGCIQAIYAHLELAQCYFYKALEADPAFTDPKLNLESVQQGNGQLQLQFGSAKLQTLVQV